MSALRGTLPAVFYAAQALLARLLSLPSAVGYQTLNIYKGNNMFTINFENITNDTGYTLDELFPYQSGMKSGQSSNAGDWIMTWDPTAGTSGAYGTTYFMYRRSTNKLNYHWVYQDGGVKLANAKIKSGMCFWYYKQATQDTATEYPLKFSPAGRVEYSQSGSTITIHPGMNMIGAPFAADMDLNTLGTAYWQARYNAGEASAGQSSNAGDWVMTWDPTAGTSGEYGTTYFLYRRASNKLNYTWVYQDGGVKVAPAGFIKMGQGAWYNCAGTGFTMEIPYPYDLND